MDDLKNIFTVDENSDLPIWVQLRNRIAYLIRTGYFEPGEQLPSVRSLSADAKINYNTVTKSYNDLEQSGLIVSVRGRGMYVQKSLKPEQETEGADIDVMVEDCIRRYRMLGMTFSDARERIEGITTRLENESISAADEKRGYYES